MNFLLIDKVIKDALLEDAVIDDITTNSILDAEAVCEVDLIAKEEGVICGLEIFKRTFDILGGVEIQFMTTEGSVVKPKEIIAKISGTAKNILSGERVALNLIQRMSGIATKTNKMVKILDGTGIKLMDTRKTTPNLRYLEKYSVKVGGGNNHRYNLMDMAMIKDNHIMAAGGSLTKAVLAVRNNHPFVKKIEVETESLDQVREAVEAGADIIMLDNMNVETMGKAIEIIDGKAIVEISGNVDEARITEIRGLKVDYISSGALTHSYRSLDISMKNLKLK
ncbi:MULTISPECIES: carboxylating nicotinate-nucleotide diphosphorylase [Psychrilyobacter]|uniref:nicotinate-nucleotide diphosphorylase (carboxylating) n=1 Tax=Psychrilyobacter piezotolerans TaxID=2293438 RepID=A0ABX9KH20_9FUSO|nr:MULTISPECIES: carboxylating nicotinate-nucleotide diphosphorylase [Psychrilyobacter]MCS5421177.1 carboxylating nicotinate-nucleotide diphosphorylase [Psychrilyobacter sp. S5]NDI77908.1 carboxylating nicotinate-nucleotide diphosphorylase [Psychrilyobacter piezotolerans]RDE62025.1 carboxylating nicotinate-nucleotide diphosphorylase [Psychrilyobacter sp. S5]REI41272.1 carboxylating nicotinate-nucleotide diphosphorylase [Psychrilyobacter piezotolerans]